MRKPVFDAIRAQRGRGFTTLEVEAVDALLDQLGFEQDAPAVPPAPDPPPVFVGTAGLVNPQAFFDSVRNSRVLGRTGLRPGQVNGLETVLDVAKTADWPLAFTAYALATAGHETAFTMQPVREAYWLSENWRRTHLRYYPFYGRGYVQLTWRPNYERADRELGLGGSLNGNLDRALEPDIAARIMVRGMQEGWFAGDTSGRHTLARHLGAGNVGSVAQFTSARRIINGTDKAAEIAFRAVQFQTALQAGGW